MIAQITFQVQYGRQSNDFINHAPEHDGEKEDAFAHSVQDAVEYVMGLPLFKNAIVDELEHTGGVRYIISSEWIPRDTAIDALFDFDPLPNFIRQQAIINSRNTIHENTGYGKK